jgi:cobalt-zinc-cadmium efflux system protein
MQGHSHAGTIEKGGTATGRHQAKLGWALALALSYMTAEVAGGLLTGSLALLADAAHMLTDAVGLALALLAIRFAQRPATPRKTYGYVRAEILSALANAVLLLLVTVYILYEAYERFISPPEILSGPMLVVAVLGLGINLVSMRILAGAATESLNVKGAYLDVVSDMLGSLGVIVAALIVMVTGWTLVDPLIGAGIGLFIVPRTWNLLRQAVHILLEGVPPEIDMRLLEQALREIPGVVAIHDLHVWTITSGLDAMSGHLVVADMNDALHVLRAARQAMKDRFGLEHVTLQIEDETLVPEETKLWI